MNDKENYSEDMTPEQKLELLISDTDEYAQLISEKNYGREKFLLLSRSVLEPGMDLQQVLNTIDSCFDLDNASGAQLDIIGNLVGASRELNYVPATGDRIMDDDEFRMVLKLTIAMNTWDGSLGALRKIYNDIFGESATIVYNDCKDSSGNAKNMHVTVQVYGDISTRETEILNQSGLLLVPVGVSKDVVVVGESVTADGYVGTGISGIEWIESVVAT